MDGLVHIIINWRKSCKLLVKALVKRPSNRPHIVSGVAVIWERKGKHKYATIRSEQRGANYLVKLDTRYGGEGRSRTLVITRFKTFAVIAGRMLNEMLGKCEITNVLIYIQDICRHISGAPGWFILMYVKRTMRVIEQQLSAKHYVQYLVDSLSQVANSESDAIKDVLLYDIERMHRDSQLTPYNICRFLFPGAFGAVRAC